MQRLFLDPGLPLVHAVADWLAARLRPTPAGVPSLAHLLVVVPTRQAGRRLRQALAERAGGCLPPLVRLPAHVIAPARAPQRPPASPAETLALLSRLLLDLDLAACPDLFPEKGRPREKSFAWALGVARQFADLWAILQENALTMADVAAQAETLLAGEDLDVEIARWRDLAAVERACFDALLARGRTPAPLARRQAVEDPLLPDGVEAVVLPALADAQPALYLALERLAQRAALTVLIHADPALDDRFDRWGRPEPARWLGAEAPRLPLADEQLLLASDTREQARAVADLLAAVSKDETPPALGLADDTLFGELHAACLAKGLNLHNPAHFPLAASSLGRLLQLVERLRQAPRYAALAAFLRQADVVRWLAARLPPEPDAYATLLAALDTLQNDHLPQTPDDVRRHCDAARARAEASGAGAAAARPWRLLAQALDEVQTLLAPAGRARLAHLADILQTLFADRVLRDDQPGDRELAAAAQAALAVFDDLASELLESLVDDDQRAQLFDALLRAAFYQLEPDDPEALLTEGWLELPWSPARELVVTGFNEGAVPDAVVGHAFLPDRLRQGLGLMCNDRRAARDTYLLHALLASRAPQAVRLTLARAAATGDALKPSRLLFLCDDDTLAARARRLYSDAERAAAGAARALPEAWRLRLPAAPPPTRVSVTALNAYLACPFTFYLKHVLRMEARDDRAAELDAAAFGTLCHAALEAFAQSPLKDAERADAIAAFLDAELWRRARETYGPSLTAIVHLQASSAAKRLRAFAERQAELRAQGWLIHACEQRLTLETDGVSVSGRADRVDYHPATDTWRVLDIKTWNTLGKKEGVARYLSSAKADLAAADARGLPAFDVDGKPHVWTDLQLPLYLLMLQDSGRLPPGAAVECGYFVLGETAAETVCAAWRFDAWLEPARQALRRLLADLRAGVFWPPAAKRLWARDYASLFLDAPETSVCAAWIADQERRR